MCVCGRWLGWREGCQCVDNLLHIYIHTHKTHRPGVAEVEVLVRELVAVNALEARAVPLDEVAALDHEVLFVCVCVLMGFCGWGECV